MQRIVVIVATITIGYFQMWQSCYRVQLQIIPCNTTNGVESINSHVKNTDDMNGGHIKIHQVVMVLQKWGQD